MLRDSPGHYGSITRCLHWLIAILVILQLTSSFLNILWEGNVYSQAVVQWHTTIGVGILALMAIRTLWAISQLRHRPEHRGALQKAAIWGHALMYLVLLLMPLSGMAFTWGLGYGVYVFGTAYWTDADVPWAAAFGQLHAPLSWLLSALVTGHIVMAGYHRLIRRDDTLHRMLGR
ncbi:cytochrome b [Chromohalobacter beijerinckii]|uniref:Cytochrome b n=1 Tax=Chromohalobacter beijerinckii TaxID=86179 RepID=A0ABV8XFP0_9GAMM|nr:cytochrome b/b6 domain-containing protein [Chromohalobacter beijerinckii]MCK0764331.1 cytochrome b/b6 domain-containing protein [Chromohalobacter beijerinckii]